MDFTRMCGGLVVVSLLLNCPSRVRTSAFGLPCSAFGAGRSHCNTGQIKYKKPRPRWAVKKTKKQKNNDRLYYYNYIINRSNIYGFYVCQFSNRGNGHGNVNLFIKCSLCQQSQNLQGNVKTVVDQRQQTMKKHKS